MIHLRTAFSLQFYFARAISHCHSKAAYCALAFEIYNLLDVQIFLDQMLAQIFFFISPALDYRVTNILFIVSFHIESLTFQVSQNAQMSCSIGFIFFYHSFPCILVKLVLPESLCCCARLQGCTVGQLIPCPCSGAFLCLCFPSLYIPSAVD